MAGNAPIPGPPTFLGVPGGLASGGGNVTAAPSSDAAFANGRPAPAKSSGSEPMACVGCRTRKLKCSRDLPACVRCTRLKVDCVYPESRRKPLLKRKNVKELEARLAHVEDLLRDGARPKSDEGDSSPPVDAQVSPEDDFNFDNVSPELFESYPAINGGISSHGPAQPMADAFFDTQLIGMGMFEAPPPFDVIEELHSTFFESKRDFLPIIHPARYLKAFHSAPHMRPPMSLQYAIWASAATQNPKYSTYHDAFYRRARQYLESDELKGVGEHFITVAHAQSWVLLSSYEARNMNFTRAAMSIARGVRLCNIMGLHRLDEPHASEKMAPAILPPQDWVELEERRRTFFGAFCIDSHASVSTGWPSLIDHTMVTTHLPTTEEAFANGIPEETCTLADIFNGANYSAFAGTIGICHVFNQILAHVNQDRPNDRADDVQSGDYWKRHRAIDNTLSSAFMFLPDRLRLPKNFRNPVSVYTNLNLHASVICLHLSAVDRARVHSLLDGITMASQIRMLMSAEEVVSIMRQTAHLDKSEAWRSPLVALSLYCAACVFMLVLKNDGVNADAGFGPGTQSNIPAHENGLEFVINCMAAIGRIHTITHAFLRQVAADLTHYGLASRFPMPVVDGLELSESGHQIPLLARTSFSRHTEMQPALPGYLPLGKPRGNPDGTWVRKTKEPSSWLCGEASKPPETFDGVTAGQDGDEDGRGGKRRCVDQSDSSTGQNTIQSDILFDNNRNDLGILGRVDMSGMPLADLTGSPSQRGVQATVSSGNMALPHRMGGSVDSSPATGHTVTDSTRNSSVGGMSSGLSVSETAAGFLGDELWNSADVDAFVQATATGDDGIAWGFI